MVVEFFVDGRIFHPVDNQMATLDTFNDSSEYFHPLMQIEIEHLRMKLAVLWCPNGNNALFSHLLTLVVKMFSFL